MRILSTSLSILIKLVLLGSLFLQAAYAQTDSPWAPMGPAGATVLALRRDPFNPQVLFAGTLFGGVYKTANRGATWAQVSAPFNSTSVFSIAADPSNQGTFYVGTQGQGVCRTTDDGNTWVTLSQGLTDPTVLALAVNPSNSSSILAATGSGIFTSANGGTSWTLSAAGVLPSQVKSIIFDRKNSGVVYAGTLGSGVFKSADGGASWAPFNTGIQTAQVNSLEFDPQTQSILYAATGNAGVFSLAAGATAWTNITGNLPLISVSDILVYPAATGVYFAATATGIYLTPNGGTSWYPSSNVPANVLASDDVGLVVYSGTTQNGILSSTNLGNSWVPINQGLQNVSVGAMDSIPNGTNRMLYAGSSTGIYINTDGSVNWVNAPHFSSSVFSLLHDPKNSNVIYTGTEKAGVWKSTDYGLDWTQSSNGIIPTQIYSISQSPASPNYVYAGTSSGLYVSTNNGGTWSQATQVDITNVTSVATDTVRGQVAYFGSVGGVVFKNRFRPK